MSDSIRTHLIRSPVGLIGNKSGGPGEGEGGGGDGGGAGGGGTPARQLVFIDIFWWSDCGGAPETVLRMVIRAVFILITSAQVKTEIRLQIVPNIKRAGLGELNQAMKLRSGLSPLCVYLDPTRSSARGQGACLKLW